MPNARSVVFNIIGNDHASKAFLTASASSRTAATDFERSTARMEAAGAKMQAVGTKMTKGLTVPIVAVGAVSLKMAGDFQQATNVLVTAAGESTKNLGMVRKGILDISTSTGTSWKQVTDGMYLLEKAGYRGAAALQVERVAAQGAREEGASLATVTQAMTSEMASYHVPASQAVKVMNEMKTAAGESKTTMELFAGSLSTVLPLASANKISFADIAGSLASLTQHGTSADEAAQELAFTMRGLSAPNQVAIKEMAQLGISSIDVSKKLGDGPGGRGFAGTLNYLSQTVLHKMGKTGTVLLSTFNASKVAAHDAAIEYQHLAPATQKLADGYIKGTITQKDWTASVKMLSPQQANLAKQFATTENNAKGFQQAIRGGVSGSQTYSDAIKKMTGGANGLNAVLQLTGESMAGTNERIKRIQDSATGAGKNVSGWASTQKLFNVQLDIMKEKLAATAIKIGTVLIPVVTTVVQKVSSAVDWFTHLSAGTQGTILKFGLFAAAAGPVLSIMGRLVSTTAKLARGGATIVGWAATAVKSSYRVVQGMRSAELSIEAMQTRSYAAGLRIGSAFSNMTTGAKNLSAAVGAAGIGLAVGEFTKNSSDGVKMLGALGSAAAGAALGFSMGGPWGAAIGGVAGGLSSLATAWSGQSQAAKDSARAAARALAAENDAAQNLLGTLKDVNGTYGTQTRLATTQQLQKSGALALADKAGLNLGQLTSKTLAGTATGWINSLYNTGKLKLADGDFEKLVTALTGVQQGSALAQKSYQQFLAAQNQGIVSTYTLAGGTKNLAKELRGSGTAVQTYQKAWTEVDGKWAWRNQMQNASSAEAARNTEIIRENLRYAQQTAVNQLKMGDSAAQVAIRFAGSTSALRDQLVQLGFNKTQVQALFNLYGKVPKSVATAVSLTGTTAAKAAIAAVAAQWAALQNKVISVTAVARNVYDVKRQIEDVYGRPIYQDVIVNKATGTVHPGKQYQATGGTIIGPGTGTSDSVPIWASNGEEVINAKQSAKHRGLLKVINAGMFGYATGGTVGGVTHVGKDWIYNGTRYASERAALNAQSRSAKTDQGTLSSAAATAIGNVGSAYSPKFDVAAVGIGRIREQIKHAWDVLHHEISLGLSSAAAAAFRKELRGYKQLAAQELKALKTQIAGTDVRGLLSSLKSDAAADIASAYSKLLADAHNAGLGKFTPGVLSNKAKTDLAAGGFTKTQIGKMTDSESSLLAVQGRRTKVVTALTAAQQKYTDALAQWTQLKSSVASAISGSFDITTAGASTQVYGDRAAAPTTAVSILASLRLAVKKAQAFAGVLKALAKDGLNPYLVAQLAQAGPSALDQAKALAAATPKQISQINSQYGALVGRKGVANTLGTQIADGLYGAGVQSAKGLVDGLKSQQTALNKAITAIADGMIAQLKRKLKIHSPSQVMRWHGQMTGEGFRLGMLDKADAIAHASNGYANAAVPAGQFASVATGGDTHYHFYGITDLDAQRVAIERRQFMAGRF